MTWTQNKILLAMGGGLAVVCCGLGGLVLVNGGSVPPRPTPLATRSSFSPPVIEHVPPQITVTPVNGGAKPSKTKAPKPVAVPAYYENCAAVRAAGAAPLLRGQSGYRDGLDRDGDGVACEMN